MKSAYPPPTVMVLCGGTSKCLNMKYVWIKEEKKAMPRYMALNIEKKEIKDLRRVKK